MAKTAARQTPDVPVIDLFAGPGGLSEGFSRHHAFNGGAVRFSVKLSIEKEAPASRTLRLRAFVRQFEEGALPAAYYDYVRSTTAAQRKSRMETLRAFPEWEKAEEETWLAELGKVNFFELHTRIKAALNGEDCWVLLGGPPCQAYSVVGRSRRIGKGEELRRIKDPEELAAKIREREEAFFRDEKHTLYKEYLQIVALHQPPVFVMENVKGILSSKIRVAEAGGKSDEHFVFDQILKDLEAPWKALDSSKMPDGWEEFAPAEQRGYVIHSFVHAPDAQDGGYKRADYLIKSEDYGVPQERHRVILLGIRDDIDAVPSRLTPVEPTARTSISDVIGGLPELRSGRSGRTDHKTRTDTEDTADRWQRAIRESVADGMLAEVDDDIRGVMRRVLDRTETSLTRGAPFAAAIITEPAYGNESLRRWLLDERLGGVLQHETRNHMDSDFARYLYVAAYGQVNKESPKLRHFPDSLLPKHENAKTPEGRRIFHDRFRVQIAHQPASTITSHIRKDGHYFIHYDPAQCRSLTVREAARVQTFPDNYLFEGNRTEQYEQVGNAVPPFLAVQLAAVVDEVIQTILGMAGRTTPAPEVEGAV
ncbi:DNA cytosine methyltransferase (plasmid) [Azospirillum argentinense]|uniref:DNA (cytosine-5-)-methyltransferase n=2 Tax=Azospirillum argentinense TaxID=2970906 RepID=A0A4D8PHW8_9PROT|nr:DNA cytosine methyltransferase [Azospirillum argentinense]